MSFWSGDTALEVGTLTPEALARADLSDRDSFIQTVDIVKRYVRSKMQKYKSVGPALPGGKLEALEKKYAHLGFQDVFYLTRLELQLPASSLILPRPTEPVRRRLEEAGYPLPEVFAEIGAPISPAVTRAASVKTRSGASSWVTDEEFAAGMPLTRETFGLAAKQAKKVQKEAEIVAAAALAGQVAKMSPVPPVPPLPSAAVGSTSPPSPSIPPLPHRSPSNSVPVGIGIDLKYKLPSPSDVKVPLPSCGCLDHSSSDGSHTYAHSYKLSSDYKLSGDYKEVPRGDSPTIPLSPARPETRLSEELNQPNTSSNMLSPPGASSTSTDFSNRRHTADIRALFEALPPEAQALAVQRLEAKKKQEERERAAAAAERRAAETRAAEAQAAAEREEQRERDRQAAWERAKAKAAKEKDTPTRRGRRTLELDKLETKQKELEKQRAQLIATQQLSSSPEQDNLQSMVDALPTPPARVDEDARRMIEARIAALQSALAAMGVEPGSPALPPHGTRSPTISTSPSRKFSTSSHVSASPLPSPIITTPRSPFATTQSPHPFVAPAYPIPSQRQSLSGSGHGHSPAMASRHVPKPTAFNLDEHIDSLCRASDDSEPGHHEHHHHAHEPHQTPISVLPLTPNAIVNGTSPRRRESRRSPPPSYTLVDRSTS